VHTTSFLTVQMSVFSSDYGHAVFSQESASSPLFIQLGRKTNGRRHRLSENLFPACDILIATEEEVYDDTELTESRESTSHASA
jgi:hypothetical protein